MNFDYRGNRIVDVPSLSDEQEKKKKAYLYSQPTGLEDVGFGMVHNGLMASNMSYGTRDIDYPVKNGVGAVCTCGHGEVGYTPTPHDQEELETGTCCETDCSDCGTVDCGDECTIL